MNLFLACFLGSIFALIVHQFGYAQLAMWRLKRSHARFLKEHPEQRMMSAGFPPLSAPLLHKKTAAICPSCKTVIAESESTEDLDKAALEHDLVCESSPQVQKIKRLETEIALLKEKLQSGS